MDVNWVEASLCFPTFPRFCGQTFLEAKDRELALLCVQAYNDWMVEEWCAGTGGRLIPLCIIPLWDAEVAAAEVRRNAARGVHAVCFSEIPHHLGLPSIHTDYWDPFFQACEETDTVVNMHIGSSSQMPATSPDAPAAVQATLSFNNAMASHVGLPVLRRARSATPSSSWPTPRARSAGSPTSSSGPTTSGRRTRVGPGRPPARAAVDLLLPQQVFGCFFQRQPRPQDPRRGRRRQHHLRDRLPALRLDLAPHQEDRRGDVRRTSPTRTCYKIVRGNAIRMFGLDFDR